VTKLHLGTKFEFGASQSRSSEADAGQLARAVPTDFRHKNPEKWQLWMKSRVRVYEIY